MSSDVIGSISATVGGGFFGGLLLGYTLKKVVKLIAVVLGLFIAGLAYLQYQQIASINWDKIEGSMTGLTSATASILNENTHNTHAVKPWYSSNKFNGIRVHGWILERLMR